MKLKRIYIKKYKNIQEQELTFDSESNYLALIGLNGSGKSNWLEVISMIFRSLYSRDVSFSYEMEYEQGGNEYKVIHRLKSRGDGYSTTYRRNGKPAKRIDLALPRVIACYSGESNRLWNRAYSEYFNQFFRRAIQNKIDTPEMLYVNRLYWNIALISLMCSDNPEVKDFLKHHFQIEDLGDVSVTFELRRENLAKFRTNNVTQLLNKFDRGDDTFTMSMAELASMEIDYRNNADYCRKMFYYLFLAALPSQSETNPVNKVIVKIEVKVGQEGISSYAFSEGEQKMILIICLTKMLADDNTLLIFDEPDAHVHIANKKELVSAISSFKGQTILSSHSPSVVDDMRTESIRFLDHGTVNLIDKISAVSRVSGNQISLIDGAFILSARKLVVTEGYTDINYVKTAVRKLSEDESNYRQLNNLAYVFLGSANNAGEYFEKILKPIMKKMDKILFIFDYDAAGDGRNNNGKKGHQEIETLKEQYPGKLECIYYSNDYTQPQSPFYIEDYFPSDCYPDLKQKLEAMETPPTYRDLKKIRPVVENIKKSIERGHQDFAKEKYVAFKPLLDKVMDVFGMRG